MCNNNGHCRKFDAGTMCPSYRVTRDEEHLTRGRANTLRLALSGQLGPARSPREAVRERARSVRELQGLPARVPDRRRHGEDEDRVPLPLAARARAAAQGSADRFAAALGAVGRANAVARNLRDTLPGAARLAETLLGISSRRTLAALAPRHVPARRPSTGRRRGSGRRRRAVRRHVHQLLRAGERARRARGARGRRLPRAGRRRRFRRCDEPRGRCAAAARISPRASSTRRSARRGASSPRSRRTSSAAPRSSGSSRRACCRCATSSW